MEVGAAKPICLTIPKAHVVCHITPPDDEPIAPKAVPKNVYSLSPSSRSPSPSRRWSPRNSFLHDAYRALTGTKSGTLMPPPSASVADQAKHNTSCLLDVPKDGQFRNRSKSLDDGTRKTALTSGSSRLDSGDAYKIFESILKEGTKWHFSPNQVNEYEYLLCIVYTHVLLGNLIEKARSGGNESLCVVIPNILITNTDYIICGTTLHF